MNRTFLICVSVLCAVCLASKAQIYELNLSAIVKESVLEEVEEDAFPSRRVQLVTNSHILIKSLEHTLSPKGNDIFLLHTDQGDLDADANVISRLDIKYDNVQDYWNAAIIKKVLVPLNKKSTQTDLRQDIEEDVIDYIQKLRESNLIVDDPYLESYIYSLIAKIAPEIMIDGRPGSINLVILSSPEQNACMFPNGSLVINAGLIASLHSEDELVAVLCHEIAHYVLDHGVQNINKQVLREKRAKFWAGVATAAVAATEVVVATKNPYYRPGFATIVAAQAATEIAQQVCERLGLKYAREQEQEADDMANELIKLMKYRPSALADAFTRISVVMQEERSNAMYISGDHPSLISRIKQSGGANPIIDTKFEKIVSFAVSEAGLMKFAYGRFKQAYKLFEQNIKNNIAISDDYIFAANCLINLFDKSETFDTALEYVNKAKELSPNNLNALKLEITISLRLNQYENAERLLSEYKEVLTPLVEKSQYAFQEIIWIDNMLIKIHGLK